MRCSSEVVGAAVIARLVKRLGTQQILVNERGKSLFQSIQCAMCHTVQGTIAQGKVVADGPRDKVMADLRAGRVGKAS